MFPGVSSESLSRIAPPGLPAPVRPGQVPAQVPAQVPDQVPAQVPAQVPDPGLGGVRSSFRRRSGLGRPSRAGLWRIAAADVSSGNRVQLLRDGAATFAAMLELIDGARESVSLEGYIFRGDEVGQRFAAALSAAAARGVAVRVLVDWVGRMGTPRSFFDAIRRVGRRRPDLQSAVPHEPVAGSRAARSPEAAGRSTARPA